MKKAVKKPASITRKDITGLRTDFKRTDKYLRTEMLKLEGRMENVEDRLEGVEDRLEGVETKLESVDGKLDKLANTLDGFVKRVDDLSVENTVGTEQIRDHEVRIRKLESAPPTQQ